MVARTKVPKFLNQSFWVLVLGLPEFCLKLLLLAGSRFRTSPTWHPARIKVIRVCELMLGGVQHAGHVAKAFVKEVMTNIIPRMAGHDWVVCRFDRVVLRCIERAKFLIYIVLS